MRTLVYFFTFACLCASVQATATDPEARWAASFVRWALEQEEPLEQDGPIASLVVPSAEVAIAIHQAVAGAVFGEERLRDKPFVAIRSGDYWVVRGTLPPEMLGGTPVTVIWAKDGKVLCVTAEV